MVCKVNSQLVRNVCLDAVSAGKLILREEVALSKLTLMEIINQICDGVQASADLGLYSSFIVVLQQLPKKHNSVIICMDQNSCLLDFF
ncbi:unnamed protein product [Urochloa humidicola]